MAGALSTSSFASLIFRGTREINICSLVSGAIWGRPTWEAWWMWDARLISMLILLFLYIGIKYLTICFFSRTLTITRHRGRKYSITMILILIALRSAIPSANTAAKACAILNLVGVVNIPIIKFSVEWWNTLHQGSTI